MHARARGAPTGGGRATHRIVVLGGGTGGTVTANRLRNAHGPDDAEITVVDQDDRHVYRPGLLSVPFGITRTADTVRHWGGQLHAGIGYRTTGVDHVDPGRHEVVLGDG